MHEYKKLNLDRNRDSKITLNTVIMKIITEGLKAAPVMNSHIEDVYKRQELYGAYKIL